MKYIMSLIDYKQFWPYSRQTQNWSLNFIGYFSPHNNTRIKSKGVFWKIQEILNVMGTEIF